MNVVMRISISGGFPLRTTCLPAVCLKLQSWRVNAHTQSSAWHCILLSGIWLGVSYSESVGFHWKAFIQEPAAQPVRSPGEWHWWQMLAKVPRYAPDSDSRDIMRHTRQLQYGGISVIEDCVGGYVCEKGREEEVRGCALLGTIWLEETQMQIRGQILRGVSILRM